MKNILRQHSHLPTHTKTTNSIKVIENAHKQKIWNIWKCRLQLIIVLVTLIHLANQSWTHVHSLKIASDTANISSMNLQRQIQAVTMIRWALWEQDLQSLRIVCWRKFHRYAAEHSYEYSYCNHSNQCNALYGWNRRNVTLHLTSCGVTSHVMWYHNPESCRSIFRSSWNLCLQARQNYVSRKIGFIFWIFVFWGGANFQLLILCWAVNLRERIRASGGPLRWQHKQKTFEFENSEHCDWLQSPSISHNTGRFRGGANRDFESRFWKRPEHFPTQCSFVFELLPVFPNHFILCYLPVIFSVHSYCT